MLASPHVLSLHRYPVKSLLGEDVATLDLDARGVTGDRAWSVRTAGGKIGSGKNSRRFEAVPGLLDLRAHEVDGRVVVSLPDGRVCPVDDVDTAELISRHLGRPVTLAREAAESHFDDGPVSLLGTASLAAVTAERQQDVAAARFRPNLVLATTEAFTEDAWVGRSLEIGTALLRVELTSPRCVMIDAETADLPAQHGNLLAVGRLNAACLGVIATVVTPGTVSVGDAVTIR